MKTLSIFAATAAIALGTIAFADGHADTDPAAKARQAHMQLYAHNAGILGAMATARVDYDAELAQVAAENLAVVAGMNQSTYWIEGTAEGTKAQPAIWENMDDFMAKGDGLIEAADAMVELAGVDLATLQSGMAAIGTACSACHRQYRSR